MIEVGREVLSAAVNAANQLSQGRHPSSEAVQSLDLLREVEGGEDFLVRVGEALPEPYQLPPRPTSPVATLAPPDQSLSSSRPPLPLAASQDSRFAETPAQKSQRQAKTAILDQKITNLLDSVPPEIDPEDSMGQMVESYLARNCTVSNLRRCYLNLVEELVRLNVEWNQRPYCDEAACEVCNELPGPGLKPTYTEDLHSGHHSSAPAQLEPDSPSSLSIDPATGEIRRSLSGEGRMLVAAPEVAPGERSVPPTSGSMEAAVSSEVKPLSASAGSTLSEPFSPRLNPRLAPNFSAGTVRAKGCPTTQQKVPPTPCPPRRNVDPSRRAMAPAYVFLPEDAASPIMIPEDEVGGVDFASVRVPHAEVAETCVILSDNSESKSPPMVELSDSD